MRKFRNWFAAGRTETKPPALPVDFLDPAFVADPAPVWAWLRENEPVAPVKTGGYVLTRAESIEAAFTDARLGNAPSRFSMLAEKNRAKYTAADVAANIPPFLDKPRHVDMRRALSAAFFDTFAGAEDWLPDLAARHAAGLSGEVDLIADFGRPFSTEAMSRFVGLEHEPDAIATATASLFKLFAPIVDREGFALVNEGLDESRSYILNSVHARRTDPGEDLISHLIARGTLTDTEIADNALLVLADGIENIEAAIAMVQLQRHVHSAYDAPAKDLVLETLRLETPAQTIPRVVREAHERDGVSLPEGTPIFLALGSANRDPARHANPEVFDPTRDFSDLIAFGKGRHKCIGTPLGQALVIAATEALATRQVEPLGVDRLSFVPRLGHRWLSALYAKVD